MLKFPRTIRVSHVGHRPATHPLRFWPRRSYSYEEDRKIVEAELAEELRHFSKQQQTDLRAKWEKIAETLGGLSHEKRMEFIRMLRDELNSRFKEPFDFKNPPRPPPGVENTDYQPNLTDEEYRQYQEIMKLTLEPVVPQHAPEPRPLPPDWNDLTTNDMKQALQDPQFRESLKEEQHIGDNVLDELLRRLDMIEKLKGTPEAEELTADMMRIMGIKPGATVEEVRDADVDVEDMWEKLQQKLTEAERREALEKEMEEQKEGKYQAEVRQEDFRQKYTRRDTEPQFNKERMKEEMERMFRGFDKDQFKTADGQLDREKMRAAMDRFSGGIDAEKTAELQNMLADMLSSSSGSLDGLAQSLQKHGGPEAILKKMGMNNENPFASVFAEGFEQSNPPTPWNDNKSTKE